MDDYHRNVSMWSRFGKIQTENCHSIVSTVILSDFHKSPTGWNVSASQEIGTGEKQSWVEVGKESF